MSFDKYSSQAIFLKIMSDRFKTILLFSGGLASYIAQSYLGNVPTLFFKTDNKKEFNAVNKLLPTTIIDGSISWYKNNVLNGIFSPTCDLIQYKELLFAFLATAYSDKIYLAEVKGETKLTPQILKIFSDFLSQLNHRKITVLSPFWHLSKIEIVEWYFSSVALRCEQKIENLLNTTTCNDINSKDSYCGNCHGCFDRWLALNINGVKLKFNNKQMMMEIYSKAKSKLLIIDKDKRKNIITAVSRYLEL